MKKNLKAFVFVFIMTLSLTALGVKPCRNYDVVTNGGVCGEAFTEWMSNSNNCCTPSSGSAMVTQIFFDSGGKVIFIDTYYIPIGQAQNEMGCGLT